MRNPYPVPDSGAMIATMTQTRLATAVFIMRIRLEHFLAMWAHFGFAILRLHTHTHTRP